ncbi:hypothetical protein [Cupriavidus taiwanensis]|uniref:DUF262 domain-containing protein n=1 Tax=Cupriavidus taiwanensis TaxID=164546 RepID=A0A375IXT9_9BURK|nr:hypothetical protein [Cupriavidus taiwanensis]SPR95926.1 conserved hypothetical protein [Cupriavidus taiwanensis]
MVIDGFFITGRATYNYALANLLPLINRLDFQRDTLREKLYQRLQIDINKGCIMPPITIAMVDGVNVELESSPERIAQELGSRLQEAFVLDGIQRLNTLRRAADSDEFNGDRWLYINFIISTSKDRLLYRMITLNNGQRPMSARHQIEALADSFFDFDDVELDLLAEKGGRRVKAPGFFKKADFVKGYMSYLSNTTNVDNNKIIEEKMDELLAVRILDSEVTREKIEFEDVVNQINRFNDNIFLFDWIRITNNFIGFCVGAREGLTQLSALTLPQIEETVRSFEHAFSSVDVSKVKLGKVRRECVAKFISDFEHCVGASDIDLLDQLADWLD